MSVAVMHQPGPSTLAACSIPRPFADRQPPPAAAGSSTHTTTSRGRVEATGDQATGGPVRFPRNSPPHSNEILQPLPVQALKRAHARTLSASSSPIQRSFVPAPTRVRAASVAEQPRPPRSRTNSQFLTLPRGIVPKASPVSSVSAETEETIGAFSPTSCPRLHLHHLLGASSARRTRKIERLRLDFDFAVDAAASRSEAGDATSPTSPIPSICRTPSSYDAESDYFPTAPSSAGPATPVHSVTASPVLQQKALRPILEALEDASRFRVQTACASCRKVGSNFPCCPRCGEMWCSRACRVQSTGGKKHVCAKA